MEEKDEIIISLPDVWNIIKKNVAFIIVVTLICAIGSFFITRYFIPKSYTSSIQLYVDMSNDDENKNNLNILSEQTYAQNLVATYIKMLNTNTFYTELSEHINNKYTAKQLSKMVSFSSDEKTEIFDADKMPADKEGCDIGPKTIKLYSDAVKTAKTVVWNGPMGVFENPVLAAGTKAVAAALADTDATTIIGGGDSAAAVNQLGYGSKMSHISTGGGASLEFLEGKELPGVAAANDK